MMPLQTTSFGSSICCWALQGLGARVVKLIAFVLLGLSVPVRATESDAAPDLADDIRVLDRASELLTDESRWNRQDTRECLPQAQTISLFCGLHAASIEVLGRYDHRRAALEEVRLAIEELSNGRTFEHRLMDFNNLPATTFSDIKQVLAMARAKIAARARSTEPAQQAAPTRPR
jgi:hypothetical protein